MSRQGTGWTLAEGQEPLCTFLCEGCFQRFPASAWLGYGPYTGYTGYPVCSILCVQAATSRPYDAARARRWHRLTCAKEACWQCGQREAEEQ